MKKIPLLANFEEWMKLATDNKINAANSWNFALIDYFHDMSLLKEGDGVNFQKASCTLDGCVKIYTSRVDSVATETGRLLSGLADSAEGKQKKQKVNEDGEIIEDEEEGDENDEDGNKKPKKKRAARSHEATLAPNFAALQLKKLELEFAVDPLFKKASADFDEGGAKGLLLNHLSIDSEGRIVFDSSDDAGDATKGDQTEVAEDQRGEKSEEKQEEDDMRPSQEPDQEIELDALACKFFPDLSVLDQQDICPSMKGFSLDSGDLPMIKAPDDWKSPLKQAQAQPLNLDLADQTGLFLDSGAAGFGDDDGLLGGFDVPDNVGFGEGGEAWAKDAALEPMLRVARAEDGTNVEEGEEVEADGYTVQLHHGYREDAQHEQILSYFSNAMQAFKPKGKGATWMGGEYWRIEKIKKAAASAGDKAAAKPRKEKEKFEIDFFSPIDDALKKMLAAPAVTNASITLPRAQWRTRGRNLLEVEDEPLDPALLLRLWLKPKARVGGGGKRKWKMGTELTAGLFGQEGQVEKQLEQGAIQDDEDERREGDYDANFFADDGQDMLPFDVPLPIDDDDDEDDGPGFTDAREMLSPAPLTGDDDGLPDLPDLQSASQRSEWPFSQADMLPGSFGSQLITQAGRRTRPEFVNYARTAKKVDIRRLKENMWQNLGGKLLNTFRPPVNGPPTPAPTEPDVDMMDVDMMDVDQPQEKPGLAEEEGGQVLKFTDMIGDLKASYGDSEYKDISTSYCMIVLLHLANEKGLVLQGMTEEEGMGEIVVQADKTVGEGYVGE